MPLAPGDCLGPYEIVSLLGKGGMGEVWRARDSRLDRDVAIKVSTHQFSDRFEREARSIAALNHPNICTLYDVGPNYLLMELIEGPTLAERIRQGPIPLDEALGIAQQIAQALDAAHEQGLVHRDLKPANIKIRPDGTVKVLDFGIAKSVEQAELNDNSPTMLSTVSMILGTAAYMAPEQARGKKDVDKRADIWAFGVVLFEMLTGRRLFQSEDLGSTLAAVIVQDPDLSGAPPQVLHLLKRCLEKDPKKRLRDIGDAQMLLEAGALPAPAAASAVRVRGKLPWIAASAAALLIAVLALGYAFLSRRGSALPGMQTSVQSGLMKVFLPTPQKAQLGGPANIPMISPDGRYVAFAATIDGKTGLWLREMDALHARPLPGASDGAYPFWSPDSRWIAFFAGGKLLKIEVSSGNVITLCDVHEGRSGTWNKEGLIVYSLNNGGLFRVPAAGGTPTPLTVIDSAAGEVIHRFPSFLPDGRHFIYTARSDDSRKTRIYVDTIDTKPGSHSRREVLAVSSNAVYAPRARAGAFGFEPDQGYLLFMRESTLMAQPFDAGKAKTTGDAVPAAEQVDFLEPYAQGQFSVSQNGNLVYTSGTSGGSAQLTWFDRSGRPTATVGAPAPTRWASISPDGSMIATDRREGGSWDVWLLNLARGSVSRSTFGPADDGYPVWSPDGARFAFSSIRNGPERPYQKLASAVSGDQILDESPGTGLRRVTDWSRDGRYLIEEVLDAQNGLDIWVIPVAGDKKPYPYLNTHFHEEHAKLSPNGQFLAYVGDESNRSEVYVQTFPEHGGKWQISTAGGDFPVWSRDGRELYFIGPDLNLMAVDVKGAGNKFEASVPKVLFEVPQSGQFDVSKDGRFLIQVPQDQSGPNVPLTLVTNWQAALKK